MESPAREAAIDLGEGTSLHRNTAPGSVALYPPDTESRSTVSCPHRLLMVAMPHAAIERLVGESGLCPDPFGPSVGRLRHVPEAARLVRGMWQASERVGPLANLLIDGLVLQFLAIMAADDALSPLPRGGREDVRLGRAIDYIESRLGEALTIAELAGVATLSPTQFSRAFKRATGVPVWSWVQARRCERARELATTTRLPLSTIASRCGFADQSHMTRQFGARYGVTPAAMRRTAE